MPLNYRRWAQIAEWSLLGLVVALHIAAAFIPRWSGMDEFYKFVFDTIPIPQLVLLVAWTVLGPGPLWLRLSVGPLASCCILGNEIMSASVGAEFLIPLLAAVTSTTFMLTVAGRLSGLAVQRNPLFHESDQARYSLRTLFLIMTGVALLFGGLEALRPHMRSTTVDRLLHAEFVRQVLMVAAILGTTLGCLWAMLRPGSIWLRLCLVAVSGPVATWYVSSLTDAPWDMSLGLAVWNGSILAILAVSLLPLRLLNFRLVIRKTAKRGDPTSEPLANESSLFDLVAPPEMESIP